MGQFFFLLLKKESVGRKRCFLIIRKCVLPLLISQVHVYLGGRPGELASGHVFSATHTFLEDLYKPAGAPGFEMSSPSMS